ncbi:MAG: hypothetical protein HY680_09440 [Chloroflexi bacterium]|nr:hypothetical protein [Chloroflexota bacterium]
MNIQIPAGTPPFVVHVSPSHLGRVYPVCPNLGNWQYLSNMASARAELAAATPGHGPGVGGSPLFYVVGGYDGSNTLQTVDTMQPALGPVAGWASLAPMPTARRALAAACLDGKLYALGGITPSSPGTPFLTVDTVEEYDPVNHRWNRKAPMPTARKDLAAVELGGKIYAVGGADWGSGTPMLATLEVYDPVLNRWDALHPMPTGRQGLAAVAIDGLLYVVGGLGYGQGQAGQTLEAYNPATDTWVARSPMPTGRVGLGAAALNGRLYAMGGNGDGPFQPITRLAFRPLSVVEAYDPTTDSWCIAPDMRSPRAYFAAVTLTHYYSYLEHVFSMEIIYAIGGYSGLTGPEGGQQTPLLTASVEVYPSFPPPPLPSPGS